MSDSSGRPPMPKTRAVSPRPATVSPLPQTSRPVLPPAPTPPEHLEFNQYKRNWLAFCRNVHPATGEGLRALGVRTPLDLQKFTQRQLHDVMTPAQASDLAALAAKHGYQLNHE